MRILTLVLSVVALLLVILFVASCLDQAYAHRLGQQPSRDVR